MELGTLLMLGGDLVAALVLTLALYYRRHHRRDLVVAFLVVNVGVFAVTVVLGSAQIAAGLGLGLFGVLSIIRLRSSEISQREVAYYFASLALGLLFGLGTTSPLIPLALAGAVLLVIAVADHPALFARSRHQIVQFDQAITDEHLLRAALEDRLGGVILSMNVERIDLVNDITTVDVRYRVPATARVRIPAGV